MFMFFIVRYTCGGIIRMKCPADLVTACDKEPECDVCGFCLDHCICGKISDDDYVEYCYDNNYEYWYNQYIHGIEKK